MNFRDLLKENIEPKFQMKNANEPISLFEGNLLIRQSSVEVRGRGKVELSWLPLPRIQFELQSEEAERPTLRLEPLEVESLDNPTFAFDADLKTIHHGEKVVYIGTLSSGHIEGTLNCDLVVFHIPNFYSYNGEWIKYKTAIGTGRLCLYDNDWELLLDTVSNQGTLEKDLNAKNGFALTHAGTIQKTGGASFTVDEAKDFLHALYYFISFVNGAWCGPTLSIGTLNNIVVWEPWDLNHTTLLSVLELLNIFPLYSEIDQLRKSPYMVCDSCRHHGCPLHPFSLLLVYLGPQTFMRLNEMIYPEIDI